MRTAIIKNKESVELKENADIDLTDLSISLNKGQQIKVKNKQIAKLKKATQVQINGEIKIIKPQEIEISELSSIILDSELEDNKNTIDYLNNSWIMFFVTLGFVFMWILLSCCLVSYIPIDNLLVIDQPRLNQSFLINENFNLQVHATNDMNLIKFTIDDASDDSKLERLDSEEQIASKDANSGVIWTHRLKFVEPGERMITINGYHQENECHTELKTSKTILVNIMKEKAE